MPEGFVLPHYLHTIALFIIMGFNDKYLHTRTAYRNNPSIFSDLENNIFEKFTTSHTHTKGDIIYIYVRENYSYVKMTFFEHRCGWDAQRYDKYFYSRTKSV